MAKIFIEVCLISARGLRRSSSFWKPQWYAVAWINPEKKYCSKIDSSGNSNPTWKTKFSVSLDDSHLDLHSLAINVEVYSREPLFLRQRLHGTATVLLKEFFAKLTQNSEVEEVGSFQLRKKKSGKAKGFVDISIRISEREDLPSYSGYEGVVKLSDQKNEIPLPMENGQHPPSFGPPPPPFQYSQPVPSAHNNVAQSSTGPSYNQYFPAESPAGPSYNRPPTPPPPPPPTNVGFMPIILPGSGPPPPAHYMNMPSSNAAGTASARSGTAAFGMGLSGGALAAGAFLFGDDFMSGFDFPTGFQGGSLTISADPPF